MSDALLTPGLYFDGVRQLYMEYAWFNRLERRMQDEVVLAHIYALGSHHGTSGHLGYMTLYELASELNAYEAQATAATEEAPDDDIPF